jgi:sugar lactone lactonase YvrE
VLTEFPIPTAGITPEGITTGPDGNLWFVEQNVSQIGRITPSGVITKFSIPGESFPGTTTNGPDGNLWFTEQNGNKIGRITPSGVITEFLIPTAASVQLGITSWPDGNLWFTESAGNQIGRVTIAGAFTEFPIPTAGSAPLVITTGSDGNLWFSECACTNRAGSRMIGRITTAGVITEFPIPTAASQPSGIVAGPEGNLWFTEQLNGKIGRVNAVTFLTGTVTDEGLPIGTSLTATWSLTSGPSPVSFGTPTMTYLDIAGQVNPLLTTASLTTPGTYNIALTGSDSQLAGSSSVTVTVINSLAPTITSVNPNSGRQGQQNLSVTVTGLNTHFVQGTTVFVAEQSV